MYNPKENCVWNHSENQAMTPLKKDIKNVTG